MSENTSSVVEEIRKHLAQVNVPNPGSSVYKEECMFSFDTPESENGLFVNLSTFLSFGSDYVLLDHQKTGQRVYLHQKWTKIIEEQPEKEENKAPTKLAIGTDDGFQIDQEKFHYDKEHAIVLLPSMDRVPYPNTELPIGIQMSVDAILAMDDASKVVAVEQWEEKRKVSKYANDLVQLDCGYTISPDPKQWKCYDSGMTENLWLNLSTGVIGSGRRNFDGTGGTGAALKHYNETGKKYPLAVKLGTITPQGADVFSYAEDENDMVEDPKLAEHLAHWGINMMQMQKTEKTMAELDIDLNMKYDFSTLLEEGVEKIPLSGPGYIGLRNLGNSCYCNTIYQVLFSLGAIQERYLNPAQEIFASADARPAKDLTVQLSKLAVGLGTDKYQPQGFISPQMIKGLLGEGHPSFSTNLQQDALEYFQHLLTKIQRSDKARNEAALDVTKHFRFDLETRIQCNESKQVRYTSNESNALSLQIPVESATNHAAVAEYEAKVADGSVDSSAPPVRLHIPFESLLENFLAPDVIDGFKSSATGKTGTATRTVRFKTFPNFLMVHLCRYILAENWTAKKLDADIPMPEKISLESLRGSGLQPGETELPNSDEPSNEPVADEAIVSQLTVMGFSENACARAALAVQNSSADAAMNWLLEHSMDPDINDPLPSSKPSGDGEVNQESLAMLLSMGLDPSHAAKGLRETGGDIERAVEWCFSHEQSSDEPMSEANAAPELPSGPADYELCAIISHIGSNMSSGHYVCHIKKNGKWALFNDRKVCESTRPPFTMGYLYLYARTNQS